MKNTGNTRKGWKDLNQDDRWEIYLTEGFPGIRRRAPFFVRSMINLSTLGFWIFPASHRCRWCAAPFEGVGVPLMHAIGRSQSKFNYNICMDCENRMRRNLGGAQVPVTMLFVDIRGSTSLAEGMDPTEYSRIVDRFYVEVTNVLVKYDAFIDKLVGDEVVAFFVSGLGGENHPRRAVASAVDILSVTGHAHPDGPWVPLGIGIQTGIAFIGTVGKSDKLTEITVLGDVANTAARLSSSAGAGQIVISSEVAEELSIDTAQYERKELTLKGKKDPLTAWIINSDRLHAFSERILND